MLIVDVESSNFDFQRDALSSYEDCSTVHTASSAGEVLQIIEAQRNALAITDIRMAGMGGFELQQPRFVKLVGKEAKK